MNGRNEGYGTSQPLPTALLLYFPANKKHRPKRSTLIFFVRNFIKKIIMNVF